MEADRCFKIKLISLGSSSSLRHVDLSQVSTHDLPPHLLAGFSASLDSLTVDLHSQQADQVNLNQLVVPQDVLGRT